jgi:aldehyde:ferredoxin oxidoreductase
MHGYSGKILKIDLTTEEVVIEDLDISLAKDFIGDFGISLRLAYDLIKPGIAPLSPENYIIIGVGPLVGTKFPATRSSILTKMPLTGAISFGNCGMSLGRRLKYAGYDQVMITGQAEKPVYVKIVEDNIEFCDARALWGKDIFETTDEIKERHGNSCAVVAIGQAGENLVKGSVALVDKLSTVGKGGLPAVMGSKKLKAVVVDGAKTIEVADPERFTDVTKPLIKSFGEDPERELCRNLEKYRYFDEFHRRVGFTTKNNTEMCDAEEMIRICGQQVYADRLLYKVVGCPTCFFPCKAIWKVEEGNRRGQLTYVPISWMSRRWCFQSGAGSLAEAAALTDMANRYGIDIYQLIGSQEFAIELYERDMIPDEDAEGLLKYDFDSTKKLLEKMVFRDGIGATFAEGHLGLIRRFGKDCEKYSTHIKNIPAQEDPRPRQFTMTHLGMIVNPEGGSFEPTHLMDARIVREPGLTLEESAEKSGYSQEQVKKWCEKIGIPKEAMDRVLVRPLGYNVGRLSRYAQDVYTLMTCLGICDYRLKFLDMPRFAELYSATTGFETSPDKLRQADERVWNLFKAINVREGFSRKDDRVPPRWLEPIKTARGEKPLLDCKGSPLSLWDVEKLLDDYYEERGWDVQTGVPTKQKLISLGLNHVVDDFEKSGLSLPA